jgi:RNA polymerase sigma factor (TIGR02999 family)
MRRILIDHARARATAKRGGAEERASARQAALDLSCLPDLNTDRDSAGMLILDDAISRLENVDADAATVVRLKFFAGLTNDEAAESMGVSTPTVKRAWAFARGWLKTAIEEDR